MSAAEKERLDSITKLGILAGSGDIPRALIKSCKDQNIEPFVVAFEGHTDAETVEGVAHIWTRLGAAGHILKTLKSHGVKDLVLIGRIARPSLGEIRPDVKGAKILAKLGLNALGDDGLLQSLRKIFESEGFAIHGVQEFADGLLGGEGALGKHKPKKQDLEDIKRGYEVLDRISEMDIAQAVIVQQGQVLGIEAAEGTDNLIKRCADYRRKGKGAVLVKMPKAQQDRALDLPTIGVQTLQNIIDAGMTGIAYKANETLLVDQEALAQIADKHHIFIIGFNTSDFE